MGDWLKEGKCKTDKNLKMRDYSRLQWSVGDWCLALLKSGAVVAILSYLFYRSIWAVLPMLLPGFMYLKQEMRRSIVRCKEQLAEQFKECILSISAALKAGYAIENAVPESMEDMRRLYGEQSMIYQELELIRRGLIINISMDELLEDLGQRSGNEDICQMAGIFRIARKSGGNMPEIIRSTAEQIGRKMEAQQEWQLTLSGKRLEQRVMRCMPLGILLYIELSNPGYFASLYHNPSGIAIMTGCLAVYIAAYAMGERIVEKIVS